ncbi:2-oxoglutarate and iron-dependent oxygenase domain-containing protein [Bradyrhizobium sp. dw_411]|uniref:isopenicillin N synthase family dioxygenase n=1 Tax=Bradyrhizobium sp. dw_411 TaxID=2720082 RepID=UPI001BCADD96|nr:2-oxoglutarate and iron-dependent oxygenase domain-containing protein [Bradyrhizobium sp. dw_411]
MHLYHPPAKLTSIPVIDFAPSLDGGDKGKRETAEAIHRACRETGFFYLKNHGVPQSLIDNQFEMAKRFFSLPLEERMRISMKNSPSVAGYEAMGGQVLDSQDEKSEKAPPDLKESFYSGRELADDHPLAMRKIRSFGHNQWPAIDGFKEQTNSYYETMDIFAAKILGLIAISLDLPEDWFAKFYQPSSGLLRMIKYPPHPQHAMANQIGAGAHTDWGGVTLLAQDNAGGLEVRTASGDWIEAPPIEGTYIINLGDLTMRWTNEIYRSNMHRVKNNGGNTDRYSIPFFFNPNPDSVIETIPTCYDEANPRKFETCTAKEHLDEMFRRSFGYSSKAA